VFAEFSKFRLLKFIFAFTSGIALGLFFSFAEVECRSCSRPISFLKSVFHFVGFAVVIFMIVWIAYSFVLTLRK